jgi:hypothetical protein
MKNFQNKAKIIKVSKILRAILKTGLVLWIISMPVALGGFFIPIIFHTNTATDAETYKTIGNLLIMPFAFTVNLYLFKFFDRLKNGHLFDAQTVGNLDSAGKWWIVLWLFEGLFSQIGNEVFQMKAVWDSGGLFAGLVLIFVAWLLKEAQELQEEQELTV